MASYALEKTKKLYTIWQETFQHRSKLYRKIVDIKI